MKKNISIIDKKLPPRKRLKFDPVETKSEFNKYQSLKIES
jgi:hypothetical protein